ncbi:MAG: ATP synthase F1 subunit epsilon [Thermoanaerobaculia bacterium]
MADEPTPGRLHLVVVAHDRRLLDAECDEVQVPGSEGMIGVLPGHTPLIATLRVGEVMYRQGKIERYVALSEGFVEVAGDVVTVLTESAELPQEIDVEAARREAAEAERELMGAEDLEWMQAQARLEKAATRLNVAQRVSPQDHRPRD